MSDVSGVTRLRELIGSGRLIAPPTLAVDDVDDALDCRDAPEFDSEWMRVHLVLSSIEIGPDAELAVKELRHAAFMKAYEFENGDQLAPCISDDFGLFGQAILVGFDDPWLRRLWGCYLDQQFPRGELQAAKSTPIGEL